MKVFFDSNIHVSDIAWGGAARKAVNATHDARWRILITDHVLDEVHDVLTSKVGLGTSKAGSVVAQLRRTCRVVREPAFGHTVPGDPDDTPILRAAVAAGAHYLVTRDAKVLALRQVDSTRVITLADYLAVLRAHGIPLD